MEHIAYDNRLLPDIGTSAQPEAERFIIIYRIIFRAVLVKKNGLFPQAENPGMKYGREMAYYEPLVSMNTETINLYWEIGEEIYRQQETNGWDERMKQIKRLVDNQKHFVINRARQYGI